MMQKWLIKLKKYDEDRALWWCRTVMTNPVCIVGAMGEEIEEDFMQYFYILIFYSY
jgi:hypothetical protein